MAYATLSQILHNDSILRSSTIEKLTEHKPIMLQITVLQALCGSVAVIKSVSV